MQEQLRFPASGTERWHDNQTDVNYTGQVKDGSGLLYYQARYYDTFLGRFTYPDSIVTGSASGKGGNAATLGVDEKTELRALTVDFHEPGFSNELGKENRFTTQKGFRFQLDNQDLQLARISCGPLNPQALNRYSYVLNNPLRYTDPTGHYDNSSNTSGDAGYAQQCTNGYGEQGDCNDAQGYSNPITVETTDSTGKVKFKHNYMRVWHSGSSKYGYSGDAGIDGFMSS